MILVDTALQAREAEGKPIRVGMIGAGFMAQGLTNQIVNSVPGMRLVAIYNRRVERAAGVYTYVSPELQRRRRGEPERRQLRAHVGVHAGGPFDPAVVDRRQPHPRNLLTI